MFTLDPAEESPGLLTLSVARLLFPIIGVFGLEPGGMITTSEIRKILGTVWKFQSKNTDYLS